MLHRKITIPIITMRVKNAIMRIMSQVGMQTMKRRPRQCSLIPHNNCSLLMKGYSGGIKRTLELLRMDFSDFDKHKNVQK